MKAILALALLLTTFAVRAAPPARADALLSATLQDVEGRPFAMASLRGTPLIVNFWARWCAPCRREFPQLIRAAQRHRDISIIGIGLEDQPQAVREFAAAYGIRYPLLLAGDVGVALLLALDDPQAGLPYTIAIDGHGEVLFRKLGALNEQDISRAITRLRASDAGLRAKATR
jgi:thiol-disulfide isomerase/thioredoxin